MPNQFVRVGTVSFLGNEHIPSGIFEWRPFNAKRHGKFKIRFVSPDEEPAPRKYYIEPLLDAQLDGKTTAFLDAACHHGYKILSVLEQHTPEDRDFYRLARAIFRNRDAGHSRITREFKSVLDFVEFSPGKSSVLIVPGLDGGTIRSDSHGGKGVQQRAREFMKSALDLTDIVPAKKPRGFSDVLTAIERMVRGTSTQDLRQLLESGISFPLDKLPGRGDLDLLFTDGWLLRTPQWNWQQTKQKVRSALIYEPDFEAGQKGALVDEEILSAVRRLDQALSDLRNPRDFDRWLTGVREHGYLSLIRGTNLKGERKKAASRRANRIFCDLTWMSYELMARCYGALMLIVFLDFCVSAEREPSPEERKLFRQMHFPQIILAGLPLDFLNRPQLRWVARTLQDCWCDEDFGLKHSQDVSDLLGVFGVVVRERRHSDRTRKSNAVEFSMTDQHVDTQPEAGLEHRMCPDCDYSLELYEAGHYICPICEKHFHFG